LQHATAGHKHVVAAAEGVALAAMLQLDGQPVGVSHRERNAKVAKGIDCARLLSCPIFAQFCMDVPCEEGNRAAWSNLTTKKKLRGLMVQPHIMARVWDGFKARCATCTSDVVLDKPRRADD
jgi:hypothetical protein